MDANREARAIDWATRSHRGKSIKSRNLIGTKSRAGQRQSKSCFTATTPESCSLEGERSDGRTYLVRRGRKVIGTYYVQSQAQAIAHQNCGWVDIQD